MKRHRIAVTGLGVVTSLGPDAAAFARGLADARCGIKEIERLDVKWATGHLAGEIGFDLGRDDIGRGSQRARLHRADLLAVRAAEQALAQSRLITASARAAQRIGVCMGTAHSEVDLAAEVFETTDAPRRFPGTVADAVAMLFSLDGPRAVASNACAASASAMMMAREYLWSGAADVMLAGGADALSFVTLSGFHALRSLDEQPCSPYGRSDGLTLGEGAAIYVLETYEHARDRGAEIIVELAGCGASSDGYHPTAPDPTGRGAALALQRALADANIEPDEVDYINGHGTGTVPNDSMERKAFRSVFGERAHQVPVSSTKSLVGHTLGAAAAVEGAACVVAIRDGLLPPTLGMPEATDDQDDFDFVPNASRPARVDVAASANYGFGGSNSALVFARPDRPAPDAVETELRDVLLTGVGAIGALGEGIAEWGERLAAGRSALERVEVTDASGTRTCLGTVAPKLAAGGYASSQDWRKMNDFTRMSVAAARLAWNDAALSLSKTQRDNVAVVLASATGPAKDGTEYIAGALKGADFASPGLFANSAVNTPAGFACNLLKLHGPMLSISHSGTSSLLAFDYAASLIRRGECEVALVMTADEITASSLILSERVNWLHFAEDAVKPFDEQATGTGFGEVAIAFVLESASHAEARGTTAYAEVLGSSCVGATCGPTDPKAAATWEDALRLAVERSGLALDDIGFCAAAAPGIAAIDASELAAIAATFGPEIAVSAPKSIVGDTVGSAGAVNVLVAALALRDERLTPTANLERPDPRYAVRHLTEPGTRAPVEYCVVNAATPGRSYASAVLGAFEGFTSE